MTALTGTRRDMRAVGFALCSAVVGVIFMRLIVYFAPLSSDTYAQSLAVNALFSVPTQLLFFLIIPFSVYKFYGKRSIRKVLAFSFVSPKFSPLWLLAIPLGFCVWMVTIGVSSGWLTFLDLLGYNYSSSEPPMPDTFNFGFFVAEIIMTAVLPAICEEFIMRGGTTTVMKKILGTTGCIVFGAFAFGLFHQNVRQVFYTALFGALATFLTIKLESVYPAMLMHFTNNFSSVFFSYADEYRWAVGGGMLDGINALARTSYFAFFVLLIVLAAVGAGLVWLMLRDKTRKAHIGSAVHNAAGDGSVVTVPNVSARSTSEARVKTSPRDIMLIVALGVVASLTTISTFIWGFFI